MNYTILIVDDDMAINDMLVKYLRKNGYITYSAYSGTEALDYSAAAKPPVRKNGNHLSG